MGLVISSYRERVEVVEDASHVFRTSDVEEKDELARWIGRKTDIHEGGRPYGESAHIIHVSRTDVDPEDDAPVLALPTDDCLKSRSWTRQFTGRKLTRVSGELWRTQWLDPAVQSPIVRGDRVPSNVSYIVDAEGRCETGDSLNDSGRWLWFRPSAIPALLGKRGSSLKWHTRETGTVALSGHNVHFGLNGIGLVTVYAKDISLLPEWQQRIWAAHNVGPDGKVSEELHAAQVQAAPARTQAPEAFLEKGLARLQELTEAKLGVKALRQHEHVNELMPSIHRFRALDRPGLFALAKDLARITADDIDAKQLQTIVAPPKGTRWGSLKSLENVLARKIGPDEARKLMGPLAGVYDLRLADAHLPPDDLREALKLVGVDVSLPSITQGYQLLHSAVSCIYEICKVIEDNW